MGKEEQLLEYWRDLPPEAKEQVLALAKSLKPPSTEKEFTPQTPLAQKLWSIRQRAIASGMQLLTESELEQELAERRGGYNEF
ncbi:hypothetical protein CK510_30385 [Brunnivagina elsteri CCALA 953]|uniref:Addiction module protein n=2 Tax=Brunnivagina TaxID=3344733 RepID=A0A2A2T9W2_9CYAN|nr:hypothetical protein CK510_30385 [Calothrix elsteri CCALA 953]